MAKIPNPPWWDVLLATRRIEGARDGEPFGADDLAEVTGLEPRVASAWLGKFCRWGYVKRSGSKAGQTRWERLYVLTTYGATRKRPEGTLEVRKAPRRKVAANPKKKRKK